MRIPEVIKPKLGCEVCVNGLRTSLGSDEVRKYGLLLFSGDPDYSGKRPNITNGHLIVAIVKDEQGEETVFDVTHWQAYAEFQNFIAGDGLWRRTFFYCMPEVLNL